MQQVGKYAAVKGSLTVPEDLNFASGCCLDAMSDVVWTCKIQRVVKCVAILELIPCFGNSRFLSLRSSR
jgi:hypothetical protein